MWARSGSELPGRWAQSSAARLPRLGGELVAAASPCPTLSSRANARGGVFQAKDLRGMGRAGLKYAIRPSAKQEGDDNSVVAEPSRMLLGSAFQLLGGTRRRI